MSTQVPEATQPQNQILEDAWFRFAKYDKNALISQQRFVRQRKWILILGVTATTLAVLYSTLEQQLQAKAITFPAWLGWLSAEKFLEIFHAAVIAVPIIVTVLVAFSEKFNMGISWVMLRSSAEAIKKEIYRYRMQVEEYNPADITSAETRDVRLAKKMKIISRRLMESPVNQTDLLPYKGNLPPAFSTPEGDNGFGDMTAEQYLNWRVEDQFSYYQKKAARLGKDLRRFQFLIIFLGGVGALLAAIKLDIWLAVSNSLAVAFTSYLEFKRTEATVVSCNLAAADLYDIRIWWHALSPEARTQQRNVETLVLSTEAVLQTENAGWFQEMREALSEIYKEKKDDHSALSEASLVPETPATPPIELKPQFVREPATSETAIHPEADRPDPPETIPTNEAAAIAPETSSPSDIMPEPETFIEPAPGDAPTSIEQAAETMK